MTEAMDIEWIVVTHERSATSSCQTTTSTTRLTTEINKDPNKGRRIMSWDSLSKSKIPGKDTTDGFFDSHSAINSDLNKEWFLFKKTIHERYSHPGSVEECQECPKIVDTMRPWLAKRREHRQWQKRQGIPSEAHPLTRFTAHHQFLNVCPCYHPKCFNICLAEYEYDQLLDEENKKYFARTGRPLLLWLPLVGPRLTVRRLARLEKEQRGRHMAIVCGRYLRRSTQPSNPVLWKINPGWALLPPLAKGGDIRLASAWERCALEWDSLAMRQEKVLFRWIWQFLEFLLWVFLGGWLWGACWKERGTGQTVDDDHVD